MTSQRDPALDRMTAIIGTLVAIMHQRRVPAVDFIDEKAILGAAGIAVTGIGEATGPGRASAAMARALADLDDQVRRVRV